MNKTERIEELVKLAEKLPAQGCENLVCVAQGMAIAAGMAAERRLSAPDTDTRSA